MKYLFLIILSTLTFLGYSQKWVETLKSPTANFFEIQRQFYEELEQSGKEKIPGFKQFKRWEYFMETRIDSLGNFNNHASANLIYNELTDFSSLKSSKGEAGDWTQIGPFGAPTGSGAGRTNCIAFHPTNPYYIIVGSASGGIWRSFDGGNSWATNTDGLENLGFSDIVIAPSDPNIVYAATGDRDGGDTYSIGVLKSTDGGMTWNATGVTFGPESKRKIYKLLVHPQDENIVYMASSLGFRKTTDGGQTWVQIRAGSFVDAQFKPNDPNTIYAATTAIVIKTIDGGQTWTNLSIPFTSSNSRLIIGVTAADPNYVYVLAARNTDNGFGGLYRSTDGGATFVQRASSPNLLGWASDGNDSGGQGWYDLALGVSQTNPNLLFVGGVNVWRSVNGGSAWSLSGHWTASGAPYVHADIHELKYSPHNTNTVWACTDGGLSISVDNGNNWVEKNTNLSIAQMYRLGASSTNAGKVLTGWQDNGTNFNSNSSWAKVLGGDGMECIIDYSNNNYMYGSLYYGNIRRSTNGGSTWTSITDDITEQGAWVTPYVQDPNNPAILYAGFNNVYRTTNRGASWTKISNFNSTSTLQSLAVAPSNSSVIYTGTLYYLYKTTDGGATWTNITSTLFNANPITYIAVHPENPQKIWVTLGNYSAGYKVFHSSDGGANWTNISGNLPNLPANTIVIEKNSADAIYVGMDVGVFYRDSNSTDWVPFMKNLPNVIVNELEIFYPDQKIRAATYGRGLWESPLFHLANSIKSIASQEMDAIQIAPNPVSDILNIYLENAVFNDTKLELFSSSGKLITSLIISNTDNYKLNMSNIADGVYLLKFSNNQHSVVKKIVKY